MTTPHTGSPIAIRDAVQADGAGIARIYNHYVAETVVTFELDAVSGTEMGERIVATRQVDELPWLVAEGREELAGYAYASKWKGRCAYRFAVEITVYLDAAYQGRGLGTQLYRALFDALRTAGMHTVIAGISLPNPASIALHEKMGLDKVGHFREVGYKFDRWIDVGYWQASLAAEP